MISFIVIGKNEGWRLSLCLESIFESVNKNRMTDFEVIYVDSKSVDNSLKIAEGYSKIKIYKIEGRCSAAIARNIGAEEAKGDIFVFLDGDMKLDASFLRYAIHENGDLIYPFLTGIYKHCYYACNNIVIEEKIFDSINDDILVKTTGGFFIITKILWQRIGGMDNRLDRNEDIDLGLRLCKINIPPLMLAKVCVNHYTFKNKLTVHLLECAFHYRYSSVLTRKHLLNIHYLPMFLRMNYTSIYLFAAIILSLIQFYFFLFYFLLILIRAFMNQANRNITMIIYYFFRDIVFVFSFFMYHPSRPKILYKEYFTSKTSS